MYTRRVVGRTIELGVTGKLYKDALVMYDRETGTLWTQVDGSALRGPLSGNTLQKVPATQTTWKVWKALHPNTRVLRRPAEIRGSSYEDYFSDPSRRGLFGTRGEKGLSGKTLVLGLESGGKSVAIPLDLLYKKPLMELTLDKARVVVLYSRKHSTASVFQAEAGGRALTFTWRERDSRILLEDEETGSIWDPVIGRALEGSLKGRTLVAVPYMKTYWYAWSAYRPGTRLLR